MVKKTARNILKITTKIFTIVFLFMIIVNNNQIVKANESKIIYFYSPACSECAKVHEYFEDSLNSNTLETIEMIDITQGENLQLMKDYFTTYNVSKERRAVPIIFAGDKYFSGTDKIINSFKDHSIQDNAVHPLKELVENNGEGNDENEIKIEGFFGVIYMMFSGLLDGFNPCAMAMLLLFISLLSFSSKKSTLIGISFVYIAALFISYFALGTILFQSLHLIANLKLSYYISIFIIILCSILFLYNIYDYIVTRNEDYGKVKLQLPKPIQKFNKKFMKFFTKKFNEGSKSIYIFTFLIGVVISFTEFLCTGQIYLPVIVSLIQSSESFNITAIVYLSLYNLAFVTPLIILSVIAIRTKSIMAASNKIREKMHIIKLFNALLFLVIVIFYIFRIIQ